MTEIELTACINYAKGLWPSWECTDGQRDVWADIFRSYGVNAVKVTLRRHASGQAEGKDYQPNKRKVIELLATYREYKDAGENEKQLQAIFSRCSRVAQAIVTTTLCRRHMAANKFDLPSDRDACDFRLAHEQGLIDRFAERKPDEYRDHELQAVDAMDEIDQLYAGTK